MPLEDRSFGPQKVIQWEKFTQSWKNTIPEEWLPLYLHRAG